MQSGDAKPIRVVCTMTKRDDGITFDFDGSSAQNEDAGNMTLVGAWGQLFVALSSQLFWNIPWNGGMVRPVTMKIPEGTFLNCRYPAACGDASAIGGSMTAAASECIAKMLYAAGLEDDVNASWYGSGGAGKSSTTAAPGSSTAATTSTACRSARGSTICTAAASARRLIATASRPAAT